MLPLFTELLFRFEVTMEIVQDMKPIEEVVFSAYETPLKALRRTQLWRLADIHGVEYPDQATATIMQKLLENAEAAGTEVLTPPEGMTPDRFWKLINGAERAPEEKSTRRFTGQTNVDNLMAVLERMEAPEPKAGDVEIPQDAVATVESMDWATLRALAKEMGIKKSNTDTAEILKEKILGQNPS